MRKLPELLNVKSPALASRITYKLAVACVSHTLKIIRKRSGVSYQIRIFQ